VVVVQGDAFNASRLRTVVVVPLTSNVRWATSPGNVLVTRRRSGLPKDSVANVTLVNSIDRSLLTERVGRVSDAELALILNGIDLMLGRE
jgi:mRNA interferase MazF